MFHYFMAGKGIGCFLRIPLAGLAIAATVRAGTLQGRIVAPGVPAEEVGILVVPSLTEARLKPDGSFAVSLSKKDYIVLITAPRADPIKRSFEAGVESIDLGDITLSRPAGPLMLDTVSVEASRFTIDDTAGAILGKRSIFTTPGAWGNVARALQDLPGVQRLDDGSGLFIRGGDSDETAVLVNGAVLSTSLNGQAPLGSYTSVISPNSVDRIDFQASAFSPEQGNALSGVVSLETPQKLLPLSIATTLSAGGGNAELSAPYRGGGAKLFGSYSSAATGNKLFPSGRQYVLAPTSSEIDFDFSQPMERAGGWARLFTTVQHSRFIVADQYLGYAEAYAQTDDGVFNVANVRGTAWGVTGVAVLGREESYHKESFGSYDLETKERSWSAKLSAAVDVGVLGQLKTGFELAETRFKAVGSLPVDNIFTPGAPTIDFTRWLEQKRNGWYALLSNQGRWGVSYTAGVRSDASTVTRSRTYDPRLMVAKKFDAVSVFAGVGRFHQIPSAIRYLTLAEGRRLAAMRADHFVVGAETSQKDLKLRLEAYVKDYADLKRFDRYLLISDGDVQRVSGIDFLIKKAIWNHTVQATGSLITANRTEARSGYKYPASTDVPLSAVFRATRSFEQELWQYSISFKYASGGPQTPLVGARSLTGGRLAPVLGAVNSERLPAFGRLDVSIYRYLRIGRYGYSILFVTIDNMLDRENARSYRYNADFTSRKPVPTFVPQSIFAGITIGYEKKK